MSKVILVLFSTVTIFVLGCASKREAQPLIAKKKIDFCEERYGKGVETYRNRDSKGREYIRCGKKVADNRLRELYLSHAQAIVKHDNENGGKAAKKILTKRMMREINSYLKTKSCPHDWTPEMYPNATWRLCVSEKIYTQKFKMR